MVYRRVATVGVALGLLLGLAGCSTLSTMAEMPREEPAPVAQARTQPPAAETVRAPAPPMAAGEPMWLERYIRHRIADFADIFGVSIAFAPPFQMYGADFNINLLDRAIGLGYIHADNTVQIAMDGRATYIAPYKRDLWRLLVIQSDYKVVDVAKGVGNGYAKPEAYPSIYAKWRKDMLDYEVPAPFGSRDEKGEPLMLPAKRMIHNPDKEGAYTACPDGWQRHIFGAQVEVTFPGEPLVLKSAVKLGIKLNECEISDFVLGLLNIDIQHMDDLYNRR